MRDLFFVGLIVSGLLAVGASLMPPHLARKAAQPEPISVDPSLNEVIHRVDKSFFSSLDPRPSPLSPPLAPNLQICRRLALGLMGTVPSLEEIRQIESTPPDQRTEWWLDHIFADRRFADYVGERMARAYVGTESGPFLFYRRRRFVAWLADAVAQNRPYDQLVRELIADDGLWTDKPATNFVSVTSQQDKDNQPDPVRLAGRVTRAFLGLRLDCAQCHDHPFAPWVKGDFEGLSAFFGQTHIGFKGIYEGTGDYEVVDRKTQTNRVVDPHVPFAPELLTDQGNRRQQLALWITNARNPYFARAIVNRVWALMIGRPLVEPVDNLPVDGQVPEALQLLADDFSANGYDLRRLIRAIAGTRAFRMDSVAAGPEVASEGGVGGWSNFPLTRLRPEQMAGSALQAFSVSTINAETHLLGRLIRFGEKNDFITRYGDDGEDDFDGRGGTIPQRLLMMNGKLIRENLAGITSSARRISWFAPDDAHAVESAYLAALTRRPTTEEADYFRNQLKDLTGQAREDRLQDLFWALINSTEFSWNH